MTLGGLVGSRPWPGFIVCCRQLLHLAETPSWGALTASCRQTETSHWPDRQNSSSLADGRGVQAVRKVRAKDANIKALTHCLTCPLKK